MNHYLENALGVMEHATRDMTEEELRRQPQKNKWSIAEVLEHLTLTFSGTIRNLEKILASGAAPVVRPNLKQRIANFILLDLGYFPTGRQSPDRVRPTGQFPDPRGQFRAAMIAMDAAIDRAQKKFGSRQIIAVHPMLGPLTADQWRKFHYVHTRHHMKQIAGMKKAAQPITLNW